MIPISAPSSDIYLRTGYSVGKNAASEADAARVATDNSVDRVMTILLPFFTEIVRRAVDGTIPPLFVDYTNSRVIIGGTAISASPATMEVAAGDLKVVSGGSGLILASRNGAHYGRLILENPDSNGNMILSVDPLS